MAVVFLLEALLQKCKKKLLIKEAGTLPESFLLDIFWQEWNWTLRIITLWRSWGRPDSLPVFSCRCTKEPWNMTSLICAPLLLIHRKLVSGNMWQMGCGKEGDTERHCFCPLPFTTEAILQAVCHLCIKVPWHLILLYWPIVKGLSAVHTGLKKKKKKLA